MTGEKQPWSPAPFKQYKWIVKDPRLLGGKLAMRGTRLSVSLVLRCLAAGMTAADIEESYSTLLTPEAIQEALEVAGEVTDNPHIAERPDDMGDEADRPQFPALVPDVRWNYDKRCDILRVDFGEPMDGVAVAAEGVILRYDPNDNRQLVGLTMPGIKLRLAGKKRPRQAPRKKAARKKPSKGTLKRQRGSR